MRIEGRAVRHRRVIVSSMIGSRSARALALLVLFMALEPRPARGQVSDGARRDSVRDTTSVVELTAGEAEGEKRRRQLIDFSELDLGFTTFRFGAGLLIDLVELDQDDESREQIDMHHDITFRDGRFLFGGRFDVRRQITWQLGIMYDKVTRKWLFRQSGIMVAIPEISSHFFVGRAKEGFSLNKVMVGYDGWSMERMPFTDATIPILADGVKWLGNLADRHFFWNLGWFTDWQSEGQTFSSYDNQYVARIGWVPIVSDSIGTMLHLAVNLRAGEVNDGQLQLRAKPEANGAPNFIDTGKFPARSTRMAGLEAYYRPGPWLLGVEYYWQKVQSVETGDPSFHGGEIAAAWLITGETRSYNTVGNYFRAVSPNRTIVEGGPGALEAVLKLSYSDFDDGVIRGGKFLRLTPMLNWHVTDNMRLELGYGYGVLDRFDLTGRTHFLQARMQMQL